MTCIVALSHQGKVYIGGDSAGTDSNYGQSIRADQKVFHNGPFVLGFTSSFRMGQLLRYKLAVPEQTPSQDDHEYMCTTFIDAVRECLKAGGYAKKAEEQEEGGTFVAGYKGKIYVIEEDYQVAMPTEEYTAVGSGQDIALGAMFVQKMSNKKDPPDIKIFRALEAAALYNAAVRPPFHFVRSK